ncbi:MAG TPA: S41 family peptidase [Pyrinomonadaceae bacterium]|nr:S41 family peptidase [Pyrinomonadaceae bacterium]
MGYVDLRGFMEANEESAQTVAAAMNFLNNTEAIIFDLRKNGGGQPQMVALISSYLFGEQPVHLNSLYWRKDNRTEEFWTLKEVAGKRYGNKDVYILTSNRTFSAAEEFTYNLKNLKRATVIGETTGGGAHPGGGVKLSRNFAMFVPTGRAINPITKTNWEGTGVKPDVEVPADQALKTAHVAALRKIVDKTTDAQLKAALQDQIENLQKELNAAKEAKEKK